MYDTIIIGAGLSGLAAGIRLAYYERPVCIVEKHTTIGGLNSFYRLRKRDHDVGLHAVTNYAHPGTKTGPLSKLLRQLRLRWEDFDLTPQCGSSVVFPGVTLRFTNDFALFEQQVAEHFPSQIDRFRQLVQQINEHDELNLANRESSAREIVSRAITDPLLVDMIFCPLMFYGSPTAHDMDFTQFVIMFKAIFLEGFARPHEGVRLIMRKVVQQYRKFGGELRLRSGVKRILSNDGKVTGVELESGEVLEAKHVVSSTAQPRRCGCVMSPRPINNRINPEPSHSSKRSSRSIACRQISATTRRSFSTTTTNDLCTTCRRNQSTFGAVSSVRRTIFSTTRRLTKAESGSLHLQIRTIG